MCFMSRTRYKFCEHRVVILRFVIPHGLIFESDFRYLQVLKCIYVDATHQGCKFVYSILLLR